MNDQNRIRSHAIVHLTDLHFPLATTQPLWANALEAALTKLADNPRIQIIGLAVTGDLVNSPDAGMFRLVRSFLVRAAIGLKLTKRAPNESDTNGTKNNDEDIVDWGRVWIVDGNHDYRTQGLFKSSGLGIEQGNHLKRFSRYPAEGTAESILVFGLNSSDQGSMARGRVTLEELRTIQGAASRADGAFKYRVALVHHHLLPLPDRPMEFDRGVLQKAARKIYDESTKLLSNAGLVTNILLEASVDLVLHGHEHKQFAASVKYHDRDWNGQIMSVVAGPAAEAGFQLINFTAGGDAELLRYEKDEMDYRSSAKFFLWRYEDWKRVSWDRLRRQQGYYRKVLRRSELWENGDFRQVSDVTEIFGGEEGDIEKITIVGKTDDPEFGMVAFDGIRDKTKALDVPAADLPACGNDVEYTIDLDPPAKRFAPHPGYIASRISGDNFLLTCEEMAMRHPEGPFREFTRFHYQFPVEQLVVTLDFPERYAPQEVEAKARLRNVEGTPEDMAETLRMRRNLFYDASKGQVWLSLDWVLPTHQYEVAWDLPSEAEVDVRGRDRTVLGAHYLSECLALGGSKVEAAAGVLRALQQKCLLQLQSHVGIAENVARVYARQRDEFSLWAFDEKIRKIRPIAATYEETSPFWKATLPWAAGIRGRAMRRRAVEYYRKRIAGAQTSFYHPLKDCDAETHVLCVPIFLPPDPNGDGNGSLSRMVAVWSGTTKDSPLHHLQDVTLRRNIADLIYFEVIALVNELIDLKH